MTGHLTFVLAADPDGTPYLAGIVVGFVLGAAGHLLAARLLVVLGIAVVLVTTVLFLIASDPTSAGY